MRTRLSLQPSSESEVRIKHSPLVYNLVPVYVFLYVLNCGFLYELCTSPYYDMNQSIYHIILDSKHMFSYLVFQTSVDIGESLNVSELLCQLFIFDCPLVWVFAILILEELKVVSPRLDGVGKFIFHL